MLDELYPAVYPVPPLASSCTVIPVFSAINLWYFLVAFIVESVNESPIQAHLIPANSLVVVEELPLVCCSVYLTFFNVIVCGIESPEILTYPPPIIVILVSELDVNVSNKLSSDLYEFIVKSADGDDELYVPKHQASPNTVSKSSSVGSLPAPYNSVRSINNGFFKKYVSELERNLYTLILNYKLQRLKI